VAAKPAVNHKNQNDMKFKASPSGVARVEAVLEIIETFYAKLEEAKEKRYTSHQQTIAMGQEGAVAFDKIDPSDPATLDRYNTIMARRATLQDWVSKSKHVRQAAKELADALRSLAPAIQSIAQRRSAEEGVAFACTWMGVIEKLDLDALGVEGLNSSLHNLESSRADAVSEARMVLRGKVPMILTHGEIISRRLMDLDANIPIRELSQEEFANRCAYE
jgi:hypothetical protein